MTEPTISPAAPVTIATTNPSQGEPVIAKGFDDPAFLQAAEKAFADRAAEAAKPKPELTQEVLDDAAKGLQKDAVSLGKVEPEPKTDRPPTPRKASEWAAFHDAKVKVERERDELKARLDAFNGFDPKEYDNLKTERQKLAEKLDAVALERSDKFQKHFNGEAENIQALVKSALGDKAAKAIKLLDLPDSDWRTEQLEALCEDLTPLRRARLERAVADMDKLNIERAKVIENSAENWKKLQEAEAMEKAREQEHANALFDREIKALSDPENGIAPFQAREDDKAWNKAIKDRIEKAREIYSGNISPQEKARYAAFSSALPEFEKAFSETLQENEKLKAELGKLRGAEPGLESGDRTEHDITDDYKGLSHGEALAKMAERAGAFAGR